jgi:hypothetical protein
LQVASRLLQALRWVKVRALLSQVSSLPLQRWRHDVWPGPAPRGPHSRGERQRHAWLSLLRLEAAVVEHRPSAGGLQAAPESSHRPSAA